MKALLLSPRAATAALALLATLTVAAQSLGPARAQAWIGRPLDMSVPARFDGTGRNDCARAEVFYGGRRIDDSRVRVLPQGAGDAMRLRVLVDAPIDEPSVAVTMRAGCANSVTRRYVVLAEPYPDEAQALPAASVAGAPRPTGADVAAGSEPVGRGTAPATAQLGAAGVTAVVRRPRAAVEVPARPAAQAGATDHPALLRVSGTLSPPVEDPERRAAAARLWQAFNTEPHELVRTAALLQSLEAEVANLRLSADRMRGEVTGVQRRGDAGAAGVDLAHLWPVALAALVLAGAALLWRRVAFDGVPAGHWFGVGGAAAADPPQAHSSAAAEAAAEWRAAEEPEPAAAVQAATERRAEPPTLTSVVGSPPPPEVRAASAQLAAKVASARARTDTSTHIFRVDALASTLQESEFLQSLGLDGDARAVLRAHLKDAATPAPMAYYELMQLCARTEEDAREIPQLRRRFHERFQIVAPSMEELNAPGGLENHPKLLARIAAAWPTPRALDIIEKRLFAQPESSDYQLTLEAWRDLVWLYDFAQHMQLGPSAAAPAGRSESMVMAPWADAEPASFDPLATDFGRAHNFAVDFDLNAAQAPDEWREGALELEPLPPEPLAVR